MIRAPRESARARPATVPHGIGRGRGRMKIRCVLGAPIHFSAQPAARDGGPGQSGCCLRRRRTIRAAMPRLLAIATDDVGSGTRVALTSMELTFSVEATEVPL